MRDKDKRECWSCKYFHSTDDYGDHGYCNNKNSGVGIVNAQAICFKYIKADKV